MRSASEFRQMARETLRGNWKLAMGTGLAASLIGAEIADTAPNGITELQKVIQARPEVKNVLTQVFLMRSMLLPLMLLLIWGLMVVIIGGAGQMGYARFHLNLAEKKEASFSDLFSQFSRITDGVAMVFVRGFYIFCWTCLFFVPGFIKTYSYAMTPYVLMEHPEYSANEAITESRRLMDGKKWNLFCLTFSFIGWRLICSIQYIIPFIIEKDKASIGMLQRMFKIGFNRAARIMDQLADAGVVGEEEGTKPRKVLMSMEQFENMMEEGY